MRGIDHGHQVRRSPSSRRRRHLSVVLLRGCKTRTSNSDSQKRDEAVVIGIEDRMVLPFEPICRELGQHSKRKVECTEPLPRL